VPSLLKCSEKWFFECKYRAKGGVPPEDLNSKLMWADAERPHHLVFLISTYLTKGARQWLAEMAKPRAYHIHTIEGKQLALTISHFPKIAETYFADEYFTLLRTQMRNWLVHDILPAPQGLSILLRNLDWKKTSLEELAFLWCSSHLQNDSDDAWVEENGPLELDLLIPLLSANVTNAPIDLPRLKKTSSGYSIHTRTRLLLRVQEGPNSNKILYAYVLLLDGSALEVRIEGTSSFPVLIKHIAKNADMELQARKRR
jgi:hypothetical protein